MPLLPFWLLRLRERLLAVLRRCGLLLRAVEALAPDDFVPERFEPLLERDDDALRVERDFAPDELALARLFEAEPLDERLFDCLLPEALLFAATADPSSV